MVNLTRPELSLEQQLNKLAQLLVASYDNKLATLPCNAALHLHPHRNLIELPSWKMEINFALYGISLEYPLALAGLPQLALSHPLQQSCLQLSATFPATFRRTAH